MNRKQSNLLLFLIGMFSLTQIRVVGSIGISELVIFLLAPFVYIQKRLAMKREGFATLINLSLLVCLGCCLASIVNHTPLTYFLKGLASPYAIFASTVVLYTLLRDNYDGVKWILLGTALSGIVNIFVFHVAAEVSDGGGLLQGAAATEKIMSGQVFWISRIGPFLALPTQGWYLQTSTAVSLGLTSVLGVVAIIFSQGSGRSAALMAFMTLFMLMGGQKSASQIRRVSRHVLKLICLLFVLSMGLKYASQYAAPRGMLGEEAQKKFERQSRGGKGILRMLIGGRKEFFVALTACLDKPLVGFGPWAVDRKGYYEKFLIKYGSADDLDEYMSALKYYRNRGVSVGYGIIPAHSHIAGFWMWYGIFGLVFWLYVLYLIFGLLRKYLAAVPAWYGYYCFMLPATLWNIFFSPFAGRIAIPLLLTCILLSRLVAKQGGGIVSRRND